MYSTCSVLCEENECLVAWTLDKYPEVKLVSATPVIGGAGLPGVSILSSLVRAYSSILRSLRGDDY